MAAPLCAGCGRPRLAGMDRCPACGSALLVAASPARIDAPQPSRRTGSRIGGRRAELWVLLGIVLLLVIAASYAFRTPPSTPGPPPGRPSATEHVLVPPGGQLPGPSNGSNVESVDFEVYPAGALVGNFSVSNGTTVQICIADEGPNGTYVASCPPEAVYIGEYLASGHLKVSLPMGFYWLIFQSEANLPPTTFWAVTWVSGLQVVAT